VSIRCDGRFERLARGKGYRRIAGVDEAGRGSLFGPVYAAAVILAPECAVVRGIRDSKALDPEQRESLAGAIRRHAEAWAVAWADAEEIDRINILQASRLAMKRAVKLLSPAPDFLLVDALMIDMPIPQKALIKGDARCRSVAAASILAKVDRDGCMSSWDAIYPRYGLASSKGYGTPEHLEALNLYGPTPQHRSTFEPVRRLLPGAQMSLALGAAGEDG
jgi:ribonuclease HII